jgi:RNA polymerase sigma-54 factor
MELGSALIHQQRQKQVLNSVQQQSLKILQMPILDLNKYMQDAFESNPFLEWDNMNDNDTIACSISEEQHPNEEKTPEESDFNDPDDRLTVKNYDMSLYSVYPTGNTTIENSIAKELTFKDSLLEQLPDLKVSKSIEKVCRYLIESLDSRGYLDCDTQDIAEILMIPVAEVDRALGFVQKLQPQGVAARDLTECLLLQLKPFSCEAPALTFIIKNCLPQLAENRLREIAGLLSTDLKTVAHYCDIIKSLEPIPSRGYNTGTVEGYIAPEAYIEKKENNLFIKMNDRILPNLQVNKVYSQIIKGLTDEKTKQFFSQKSNDAAALIKNVKMRETTIARIIEKIVGLQKDYFIHGALIPMRIADIALALDINESTVSRAIQDKYISCQNGTIPIRSLFTSAISSTGTEKSISSSQVKQKIKEIVEQEDKKSPLSDSKICEFLKKENVIISRRTVAKYRDVMHINSCNKRKIYG